MPTIQSAKKRVRVTARQTSENRIHRERSRAALKEVRTLVGAGKVKEAAAQVAVTQSYLDKAAKRGSFHANTISRYKSRLSEALKAAGNKDVIPARTKEASAKPKAEAKAPAAKKSAAKAEDTKPDVKPDVKPS